MWLPLTGANRTSFLFLVYLKMSLSVSKSRINQYVERSWEVIMLDATTVMHFRQPSIPLAEGKASKYSAKISLTLSRVRTYVTERSPLANSAFDMLLKITKWKKKRKAWSPQEELQEWVLRNARLTNQWCQQVLLIRFLEYRNTVISLWLLKACASGKLTILERAWI